jgi:hypothetical protein
MPTVSEALASFEHKASAARARYHRAIGEGTSPKAAHRAHDQARQQAFIDLVAQVRDRQTELAGYLDESRWTSLEDSQHAPGYQAELEDAHGLTHGFGARIKLGKLWDLSPGSQQQPAQRDSHAAMNDLIRRGG